jgi:anti-sigma B factor antagonist
VSVRPGPNEPLVVDARKDASASRSLVRVRGDIDIATAPRLQRRLDTLVGQGVQHLVVDLRNVSFCDLAGVRVLLGVERELRAHGGHLTLLGPCRWVSSILSVLDLTDQLPIQASADGDGASRDGASRDGASRDGASLDGASLDGASSDGAGEDGTWR